MVCLCVSRLLIGVFVSSHVNVFLCKLLIGVFVSSHVNGLFVCKQTSDWCFCQLSCEWSVCV